MVDVFKVVVGSVVDSVVANDSVVGNDSVVEMEIANPVVDSVVNPVVDRVVIDRFVVDRFVVDRVVVGHPVVDRVHHCVRGDVNGDVSVASVVASVVASLVNNVEVDDAIEEVKNGEKRGNDLDGVVASVVSVVADVVGVPRVSLIILENSQIFYFMVRTTKSANFHPLPLAKFCKRIILNKAVFVYKSSATLLKLIATSHVIIPETT